MNVTYSDKTRQSGEGDVLLREATGLLREVVGPSADPVSAEWNWTEDEKGRTLYTLRISDWVVSATASFTLDDLGSPTRMRYRLNRLWGDLLQARNHKQLEDFQGASGPES